MIEKDRIWQIEGGDEPQEAMPSTLDREKRLEDWLERNVSELASNLMIIGRQVTTFSGGKIDLLCVDDIGDLIIVELKRDKTSREVMAQILEYASWVEDLSSDRVVRIADAYSRRKGAFADTFRRQFKKEPPESLNSDHRMVIVAPEIDKVSERILTYLSGKHGVKINAMIFHYSASPNVDDTFRIEPHQVKTRSHIEKSSTGRFTPSWEELQDVADHNGVGELYHSLVNGLKRYLRQERSEHTLCFCKNRLAVFTLFPERSNLQDGLRFRIYSRRFSDAFDLSEAQMLELLPQQGESKVIFKQHEGFEGCFTNIEEIDRFLCGLDQGGKR
jgi:hypothetical protein